MSAQATISSAVLLGLHDDICAAGLDPIEVSAACGLPKTLWFEDSSDIPLESFVESMEYVAHSSGCANFGWIAGESFDLRFLGELGQAVLAAPTLGTALRTFSDYLRLVQTTTEICLAVDGDEAVVHYRILDPDIWPRRQDAEFTLSILKTILRDCLTDAFCCIEASFEHGTPGKFDIRAGDFGLNAIAFPARFLSLPMRTGDQRRWRRQSGHLELAMAEHTRTRPMAARAETAILKALGSEKPCQHRIAEELGLSGRSLHRRLCDEGTSFSAILTDCRLRLAKHMLVHSDRPLSQIALDLGYDDQSCLSRIFRTSTGLSPVQYRERNRRPGFGFAP